MKSICYGSTVVNLISFYGSSESNVTLGTMDGNNSFSTRLSQLSFQSPLPKLYH